MKPLNKIVLLFGFSIILFLVSIWELVQTDFFGNITKKVLIQHLGNIQGVKYDFSRINLSVIPIGASLIDVVVSVENKKTNIEIHSKEVGVYFSILDSLKTKITIDEIRPTDTYVKLTFPQISKPKNRSNSSSIKLKEMKGRIKEIEKKLPFNIRTLTFDQLFAKVNDDVFEVRELTISNNDKIELKGMVEAINLDEIGIPLETIYAEMSLDTGVKVDNFILNQGVANAVAFGRFSIEKEKKIYKGTAKIQGYLPDLHKYLDFKDVGEIRAGEIQSILEIEGENKSFSLKGKLASVNGKTDFVNYESLSTDVKIDNDKIVLDNFKIKNKLEVMTLLKPVELYSFKKNKFLDEARVSTSDFELNNALRYIKDTVEPLKGTISGDILFILGSNDFHFKPMSPLALKNIRLDFGDGEILHIKEGVLEKGSFDIRNGNFTMGVEVKTENSKLKAAGTVDESKIEFTASSSQISARDFGMIAGFNVDGKGTLNFKSLYTDEKNDLIFDLKLDDVNFEGYQAERISGTLKLDINRNELFLIGMKGRTGRSPFYASGSIKLNEETLDINISHPVGQFRDFKQIYFPIFSDLTFLPNEIYGDYSAKGKITGGLSLETLKVYLSISGKNIYAYKEYVEKLKMNFSLVEQVVSLKEISLIKGRGQLKGDYQYNLKTGYSHYNLKGLNINLQDFKNIQQLPYNINGYCQFDLKGEFGDNDVKNYLSMSVRNTRILDKLYQSSITFNQEKGSVSGKVNLLDGQLLSEFNLLPSKKYSEISLQTNNLDIKNILSAINLVDESRLDISGLVSANLNSKFKMGDWMNNSSSLNIKKMTLNYSDINLDYQSDENEIETSKGKIKKWNLFMPGNGIKVQSIGSGDLRNNFDVTFDTKLKASLLENINKVIARSSGYIYAKGEFYKKTLREDYKFQIYSNDFSFSTQDVPFASNGNKFHMEFINGIFKINEFRSMLKEGHVDISGEIDLRNLYPMINLTFDMNNANVSMLDKSNIYVTGKGGIIGQKLPYTVTGNFEIDQANINYDFDELSSGSSTNAKKVGYLPREESEGGESLLALNMSFTTKNPVFVNNTQVDLGFLGQLNLTGTESDIKVLGKMDLAPDRTNKFFLNNNEFILKKGSVFFYEDFEYSNPEIDILAASSIRDYDIDIKAFGHVDDLTFDLTSEPTLSQKDIFSLVAFGYTEDISSNLSTSEQESLTTAGVGSLIFDRFKINKTLKKEFGLQVNLGTEIQESDPDLVDGRTKRVNSRTKIEVKKQMSKKLDLSLSTTMGTTTEQRQNMKLNYELSDGLSVEGVYEIRSGEINENQTEGTSVGADIKKQWTFK